MTSRVENHVRAFLDDGAIVTSEYRLCPINEGAINQNFRVITSDKHYIVKVFDRSDCLPIDREATFELQQQLAGCGLAPAPCALSTDQQIHIEEWVDKKHIPKRQHIRILASHLTAIHSAPVKTNRIHLPDHWAFYMSQLSFDGELQAEYQNILTLWDEYAKSMQSDVVLCHHDLHIQHISGRGHVCFDWEYAGRNCRFFDIASTIIVNNLTLSSAQQLVVEYARSTNIPLDEVERRVKSALEFVRFTNKLWLLVTKQADNQKPLY